MGWSLDLYTSFGKYLRSALKSLLLSSLLLIICVVRPQADLPTSVEIKSKSRDLTKVQEELNRKRQEQEQLKIEASQLSKSLQDGETKMKGVEETLMHTKQKHIEIETDLAQSKNKRDWISKTIRDTQAGIRGAFGVHMVTASLNGPSSPTAVYSRALYKSGLNNLGTMRHSKDVADQSYEDLTATYEVIQREYENQREALDQLKTGMANKERLLQKKMTRHQILTSELKDLEQTAEELASLIDVLRSQAKQEQAAEKKARQEKIKTGASPIVRNSLPWPLVGKLTKRFGRQKHPELGTLYISNGIEIESQQTSVRAVADGEVLYAGNFMSYGPMTVVEHKGDWYSVYGQLSKWVVEKGQVVKKGDVVGEPGALANGKAGAYFELRFYGKPVDPLPWLSDN